MPPMRTLGLANRALPLLLDSERLDEIAAVLKERR